MMVPSIFSLQLRQQLVAAFLSSLLLLAHCTSSAWADESGDVLENLANSIRQVGGYVHPSLQLVDPAPCGADRGVIYAREAARHGSDESTDNNDIWLRVPLAYQLTTGLALSTLTPLVPDDVLKEAPLVTLDDAALLVLLLAHLRGSAGKDDPWHPYLASLPDDPGCGWWGEGSASAKTKGYGGLIPDEIITSSRQYVGRVSQGMAQDYGAYLAKEHWPAEWKEGIDSERDMAALAIQWSLCIVSSRGTAASSDYGGGSTRLIPFADMFNHNLQSDGFIELTEEDVNSRGGGTEGAFEVRRKDSTAPGAEITVNYNLGDFSPEDWFLSTGFIPPEVFGGNNAATSDEL